MYTHHAVLPTEGTYIQYTMYRAGILNMCYGMHVCVQNTLHVDRYMYILIHQQGRVGACVASIVGHYVNC